MGKGKQYVTFTKSHLKKRELVINLVDTENEIVNDEKIGLAIYKDIESNEDCQLLIHRLVLQKHGFDTSDDSMFMYRKLYKYWNNDLEIQSKIVYTSENRQLYYNTPIINMGDKIPPVHVYSLSGTTKVSLYDELTNFNYALIYSFSSTSISFEQMKEKLFSLKNILHIKKIKIFLIYINEALKDKDNIQTSFNDRIIKANNYAKQNFVPYPIYIDTWNNDFDHKYQAYPNKYYLIDNNFRVCIKSVYGWNGTLNGKLLVNPVEVLEYFVSDKAHEYF